MPLLSFILADAFSFAMYAVASEYSRLLEHGGERR